MQAQMFNDQDAEERHINPALFNQGSYSMSRSTSGVSDVPNDGHRLLTPHLEYRNDHLNSAEQEIRKVSDSLGRASSRFYPGTFAPSLDFPGHGLGLGPHPQPDSLHFARGYVNEHFALSAERGEIKPEIVGLHGDTEYEKERAAQIMNNKKLLEDVGLGSAGNSVSRPPGFVVWADTLVSLCAPATSVPSATRGLVTQHHRGSVFSVRLQVSDNQSREFTC